MSLINTFSNYTLHQLIVIIESGEDYTQKAKKIALEVIKQREVENNELKKGAVVYWEQQIKENIKELLLSKQNPKSTILSEEEIRIVFRKAFENWKENQEIFKVDTTKYWFV